MSGGADERLILMLEARVTEFERRMAAAERRGTKTYNGLQRGSARATAAMEADMRRSTATIGQALGQVSRQVGQFASAFAGGLVGGVIAGGLAGVAAQASRTVRAIAEVGDMARRAGVDARAFQEWKFVAEQNRIGVDAMADGLKELSLRADEFISTGSGPAAEAFARLGYGAKDLAAKIKDPSELLLEMVGRLEGLDKAAQIRIADEVFGGTAGERFVELLAQGEDGLRRTVDRAHEVGAVMSTEMIERAAELDRRWNELTTRVGMFGKTLVLGAVDAVAGLADVLTVSRDLTLEMREWENIREQFAEQALLGDAEGEAARAAAAVEQVIRSYEALQGQAADMSGALGQAMFAVEGVSWEAARQLERLKIETDALGESYRAGDLTAEQFADRLGEVAQEAGAVTVELQGVDGIDLSGAIGAIAALARALGIARGEALALRNSLPGSSVVVPESFATPRMGMFTPPGAITVQAPAAGTPRPSQRPMDLGDLGTGRGGGGGGGGGRSRGGGGGGRGGGAADNRLDRLLDDLRTEREVLTEWYAESLELLQGASDAELRAVGGKQEALERLEREHQERLKGIRQEAAGGALANAETLFGGLAEIASAGGERMAKAARVLGATEALINTYRAQAQVLADPKLGFWAKFPAVAAIGAAGMRLVTAIRSGSGGGAVSSAAPSVTQSAAQTQEAAPVRFMVQGLDPRQLYSGQVMIDLVDGIQAEFKNRGLIMEFMR